MKRIMIQKELRIAQRTLDVWGREAQVKKATEECVELASALLHDTGSDLAMRDKVIHEMVDVGIMLDQLALIYIVDPRELAIKRAMVFDRLERLLDLGVHLDKGDDVGGTIE